MQQQNQQQQNSNSTAMMMQQQQQQQLQQQNMQQQQQQQQQPNDPPGTLNPIIFIIAYVFQVTDPKSNMVYYYNPSTGEPLWIGEKLFQSKFTWETLYNTYFKLQGEIVV